MVKKDTLERWTIEKSADLYGVRNWGAGYFDISKDGHVVVTPFEDKRIATSLTEIVSGMRDRGFGMPVLLRIENILDSQISRIHESFRAAIEEFGYRGVFRGVYPIKVNQQEQVVAEVAKSGSRFHHGFEAGSKAELIAALSFLKDREACLVCNGYKDEEFFDLGLYARKMGYRCFFVVETASELPLIIERAKALKVKPLIGVRVKLSTKAGGHWTESGGDRSIFGLSTTEIIDMVDLLKSEGMLDSLQLLHYHLGSQIPNIRDIRAAVLEACRIYSGLVQEGAPMGFLDLGGGLAVDYDGSHTNYMSSRNYTTDEYCADIVETIMSVLDGNGIAHPTIITESGRALVAYYSVLLFNILDVSKFEVRPIPERLPEDTPDLVKNLFEILTWMTPKKIQEGFNDALFYRDEIREEFKHGKISLRHRSLGEVIFWHIVRRIAREVAGLKFVPPELEKIGAALSDLYYGNFSIFQSLPDIWAIEHLFPIMPIHRLNEQPRRRAILADITCDSDGKIDKFIDQRGVGTFLPLHELTKDEEYYLGVFLVGAYQETLGDLHNLFGDTNVVSVRISEDGTFDFVREIEGDSVADVLSYVEYDPNTLRRQFREIAEQAVRDGWISARDRQRIVMAYESGLRGYTYFER